MRGAARRPAVLLDTCAVIWLANGDVLHHGALDQIIQAGLADGVFVSPVSGWEIGLLSRPRPGVNLQFLPNPAAWFARFMSGPTIRPADFTWQIGIDASQLPGTLHGDPADRLLIATARHMNLPIVTRDGKIQAYASAGHVSVVRC
jgi:PIN domain nuclease of toxin-antitoxin system